MHKFVQKPKYICFHIKIYILITYKIQYITHSDIHGIDTRYGSDVHQTIQNLSLRVTSKRFLT
jgi:hypothetical protein